MAETADWLFTVGVNTQQADEAVQAFVKRTNSLLAGIRDLNLTTSAQLGSANKVLESASKRLRIEQQIGETQNKANVSEARAQARIAQAQAQRLAAEQKIAALQNGGGGFKNIAPIATGNAAAIGKQKDALSTLNRIIGNTVFKFIEYEVVMNSFNAGVHEVMNSLNEASNVQMEQTLQRLYDGTINTNQALKDAIVIAKQWGSDITDVQQAIGLWTKQTQNMRDANGNLVDSQTALAAAAKLAADAEKFHAASGIESMEVYRMSVSTWHELGLKLGEIPALYDKIAYAATKISPVLKAQPGSTSKQEGIKDIFEGLAESGAALKAQGLGPDGIIAVVATQVENLGESGRKAGQSISAMFGALNQGGQPLKEWVKLLGGAGAFKDQNTFLAAAVKNVDKIKQASADGLLKVSKNQINTFREFIGTLDEVNRLTQQIHNNARGSLDFIANAQMETFTGQVKRLSAAFQEFNLALGTQVLPNATRFVQFLTGSAMPALTAHVTQLYATVNVLTMLGAAYLTKLAIIDRFGAMMTKSAEASRAAAVASQAAAVNVNSYGREATSAAASAQTFVSEELNTVEAIKAANDQMVAEKEALEQLRQKLEVVTWQTEQFEAECAKLGVTVEEVSAIAGTKAATGIRAFGTAVQETMATVMRSAGPLLLLYTAMSALSNFDGIGRKSRYIDDDAHERESGAKGWLDSAGDIIKSPLGFGDAGAFDELTRATKRKGKDAQFAKDVASDLKAYAGAKTNDQITDAAEQLKRDLFTEDQLEHPIKDRSYNQLDNIPPWLQKIMDKASGGNPAGMTLPSDLGTKKVKEATEQQVAAEAVNKTKGDAMSAISHWRDEASAAATDIKRIKADTDLTTASVNALTAAYTKQETALRLQQSSAETEIKQLRERKTSLEALIKSHGATIDKNGNLHGGDKSSALYAEAKAWRMAQEAINKATGAVDTFIAKRKLVEQQAQNDINHRAAMVAVEQAFKPSLGTIAAVNSKANYFGVQLSVPAVPYATLDSYKGLVQHLQDVKNQAANVRGAWNQMTNAMTSRDDLQKIGAQLAEIYKQHPDPQLLQILRQYRTEFDALGKSGEDAASKVQELDDSLANMLENVAGKNLESIGSILGLDPGTVQAQKTLIDGYKQIGEQLKQIDTIVKDYGGTYAALPDSAKQMVNAIGLQIQNEQKLLPLLAKQQEIQNSIQYKATESTLQDLGQKGWTTVIDKMMGQAKTGIQSFVKEWLSNVVQQWWSQTAKRITDAIFGDPAAKAQKQLEVMYAQNAQALNAIANFNRDEVVAKYGTFVSQFNMGVNHFGDIVKAIVTAAPNGTKNDGNLQKLVDVATGTDTSAKQTQTQNTTEGVNNSQVNQNTKKGADASKTTADTLNQYLPQVVSLLEMSKGSGDGTGMSGLGGSLFSSLLGSFLKSSPKAQNYLKTNGAWIGNAMDGFAQGQMFGQMMGGGSHTTWGSLGGTIGGAFFGPVGATAGSFLGSLFGHADNPAQMPDKYDTQRYTQYVGELTGSAGTAYGPSYNGSTDQMQQSLGGKPMLQYIQDWIAKNLNSSNKDTKALAQQLAPLYGTTGGGKLNFGHDIGQESVVGGSLSGTYVSIHDAAQQAIQSIQQLGQAADKASAPIIAITAVGAPAGYQANPYNLPGLTASEYQNIVKNGMQGIPTTTSGPTTPDAPGSSVGPPRSILPIRRPPTDSGGTGGAYGTPGYGVRPLPLPIKRPVYPTQQPVHITTQVTLDSHVVAQAVNAVNLQTATRNGDIAA